MALCITVKPLRSQHEKDAVQMRIISVAGYGCTGSSAVVDLLREVDETWVSSEEIRFVQEVDGLLDLCFNLSQRWSYPQCDAHIRRFIRYTDLLARSPHWLEFGERLDERTGGGFTEARNTFVESLSLTEAQGFLPHHDYDEGSRVRIFADKVRNKIRSTDLVSRHFQMQPRLRPLYFAGPEADVYENAREFLFSVVESMSGGIAAKRFVLDQVFSPYRITENQLLIPEAEQLVVDRDPRDIYLDVIQWNGYPVSSRVEDFIRYFRDGRSRISFNSTPQVHRLRFEDLILNYEATRDSIFGLLGISMSEHQTPGRFLRVDESRSNVFMWHRVHDSELQNDVRRIGEELGDWCYLEEYQ